MIQQPRALFVALFVWFTLLSSPLFAQQARSSALTESDGLLPSGFVDEHVVDTSGTAVGLTFDANGRMYVWERDGVVWVYEDGELLPSPLLDISDEVGNWRDFGLLGFALDPNFLVNGNFYLYYVVDRHHLLNFGTTNYDPSADEYFDATIGRITRYTADASTGFTTTLPSSRFILLGELPSNGVPILHQSHGTGSLVFGEDGTLLATSGDGASYSSVDSGSASETYWAQGLADGIIRVEENVGAFRSQMIDSFNGKVLRLDPVTGDGLPSNPFYDAADPRSAASRTWALGLRNPFRASLRPGTGQSDPSLGDPGTLFVGDVGWGTWEDLHAVDEPGMNLGWPLYEGLTEHAGYMAATTDNLDAPNPLSCSAFFTFQELLAQEQKDHNPGFPNPCDSSVTIAPGTPTFMHRRPIIEWRHGSASPATRVPIFIGNDAAEENIGDPGAEVEGDPFNGNCAVGGFWHSGLGLPAPYGGAYYVADYSKDWIRCFEFHDDDDHIEELHEFADVDAPVFLGEDPNDGSILYITISQGEVRRFRYTGTFDNPPVAAIASSAQFGASPLTVQLDGTPSFDPEGDLLSFNWDFGDGTGSTKPTPLHTYPAGSGSPDPRTVTLTVTDGAGQSTSTSTIVSLDNTPPAVEITSPVNGSTYSSDAAETAILTALVSDAEESNAGLSYSWEVFLHHNTHSHPEPPDTNVSTTAIITPTPCDGEFYAYRIALTVTDSFGLSSTDEVWMYPDCSSSASVSLATTPAGAALPSQPVTLTATPTGAYGTIELYADGVKLGEVAQAPFELEWVPTTPGNASLAALVIATDGTSASSAGLVFDVLQPELYRYRLTQSNSDAEEKKSNGYMRVSNADLELTVDRGFEQVVGLRFPVDVPPNAFISNAYIQFYSDETDSAQTDLTIRAEAVGVPDLITNQAFDLSSRATTSASVTWSPAAWDYIHAAGARQRTPNLAPLLQELVNRGDWSNPGSAMFLFTGVGERVAESVDGSAALAPELIVEFGGGVNAAPVVDAGPDLNATTTAAAVLLGSVTDDGQPTGSLTSLWSVVSGPGTATFTDATSTQTMVTFDAEGSYTLRLTGDDGELQSSDDVQVDVMDGDVQTLDVQITDGADDAEERADTGYMVIGNVDLELGFDRGRPHQVGLRFQLDVPQGSTITDAYVQFTTDEVWTSATDLEVFAESSDDAAPIVFIKRNLSLRPATSASVSWSPADWISVGQADVDQRTPNLAPVLQELVSRPGWQSGNHVMIFVTGTGTRTAESFEGSPADAPLLHVEFQ